MVVVMMTTTTSYTIHFVSTSVRPQISVSLIYICLCRWIPILNSMISALFGSYNRTLCGRLNIMWPNLFNILNSDKLTDYFELKFCCGREQVTHPIKPWLVYLTTKQYQTHTTFTFASDALRMFTFVLTLLFCNNGNCARCTEVVSTRQTCLPLPFRRAFVCILQNARFTAVTHLV